MLIFFRKWAILVCISVFISLRILESVFSGPAGEKSLLVVGILSAQNNFAARSSIRKTWKTLLNKTNHKFYFIVGSEFCPIHPVDRKSDLTCESLELPSDKQYADSIWTPEISAESSRITGATVTSFTFHVNFPVVVQRFRVWMGLLQTFSSLTINLKNARTGTLISSASFKQPASTNMTWVEVESKPFLLPKSFDAELQLVAENSTVADQTIPSCYGHSSWFNFSEAIEFTTQYSVERGWSNFNEETCSPISVLLKIHDLETVMAKKQTRSEDWDKQIKFQSKRLSDEASIEQDILFVDVVDVYRNIPDKLLNFYVWVHNNLHFSFLLKADDDTFLNVPLIEKYLKFIEKVEEKSGALSEMWWWGRLRHGLPVERHGKWQELLYAAPVYPPFLCGASYVLNENVVKFLSTNSRWLHRYQGEDTSLGIWLSSVHPKIPKNATCHWVCGSECDKSTCNRGQISADDMLKVWHQFQKTQSLC
ncbi:UDP-GalNAc:beta-1,3-N-acetylgalactosaminyltransferase 2-like [Thrips palmi]|uniref:Hexosyltransferase n=1 Tax=Thrips palmi TaxID=161013 RepID=A0A6P9AFQ9_THRPL|nr:UDP-GalNAc:beta-1,3-N-acetylgalactosaminyltransferase 2-like [Thrips palmi]